MTKPTDTDAMESRVRDSRAALDATVEELKGRMSTDRLAEQALGVLGTQGVPAAFSRIEGAVRANPLAAALIGAGAAWLLLGRRSSGSAAAATAQSRVATAAGGIAAVAQAASAVRGAIGDEVWAEQIDALRARASETLRSIEQEARSHANDLRDYAAERATVVANFAADMRASLNAGLEGLSEQASDSVIRAREAAYAARLRLQDQARTSGREVERLVQEHPVIAGAVVLALGAALAAALPRGARPAAEPAEVEEADRLMAKAREHLHAARRTSAAEKEPEPSARSSRKS